MADLPEDIFFESVVELRKKLIAGEVSSVELTKAFAQRLEQFGPHLNALALPLTLSATREAKAADEDFKRKMIRSPLQGIPYGAKDLLSVADTVTTWGAAPYATQSFNYDAEVITRLSKRRAPLLGKLAMVELAGAGGYRSAAASLFGPGLNPWDRSRWSGGSSSGCGSAVAAGLVPFAIGSETSGSILTPCAFCGVTGLRPTYGLVSRYGAMPLSWTMDKIGPICRTAEDCGLVLEAISGGDRRDPGSAGKSFYYTPQYTRSFADIKLGYAPVDFHEWSAVAMRPTFDEALSVLRSCGLAMAETRLTARPYAAITSTVIGSEASSAFEHLISSEKIGELNDPKQIANLKAASEITAQQYLRAMRLRRVVQQDFHKIFGEIDVLVAPARYSVAPKITAPLDQKPQDAPPPPADQGMSELIAAGNLAGLPALCLPCGFVEGLPIALQLVGPAFSENTLIAIGKAFQQKTTFHQKRPRL